MTIDPSAWYSAFGGMHFIGRWRLPLGSVYQAWLLLCVCIAKNCTRPAMCENKTNTNPKTYLNWRSINEQYYNIIGIANYGALGHSPCLWNLHIYTNLAISVYILLPWTLEWLDSGSERHTFSFQPQICNHCCIPSQSSFLVYCIYVEIYVISSTFVMSWITGFSWSSYWCCFWSWSCNSREICSRRC